MYRFSVMSSPKLSANLVIRVSTAFKAEVEKLAKDYRLSPAEVMRRCIAEAVEKWEVPGLTKRPKPKT